MRSLRPVGVAVLLSLAALGGCAADGGDSASAPTSASAPGASAAPTAAGTRLVMHEKGETAVPAEPKRVITLDTPILDTAVFLGVTPVGAVRTAVAEGLPAYLGERAEGIELVGTIGAPNLEAIAALDPDLIISSVLRDDELYDKLSAIAPTVFTIGPGTTWREDFLVIGNALGRPDAAAAAMADFEARADEIAADLDLAGVRASIVRFLPEQTRVYGPDSFSGSVLRAAGLSAPPLDFNEFAITYLSAEQIEMADADIIFSTTYGEPGETTRSSVTALWGNLAAVRDGCQFEVSDDTWMLAIGLNGANAILDDLERLLADSSCAADG